MLLLILLLWPFGRAVELCGSPPSSCEDHFEWTQCQISRLLAEPEKCIDYTQRGLCMTQPTEMAQFCCETFRRVCLGHPSDAFITGLLVQEVNITEGVKPGIESVNGATAAPPTNGRPQPTTEGPSPKPTQRPAHTITFTELSRSYHKEDPASLCQFIDNTIAFGYGAYKNATAELSRQEHNPLLVYFRDQDVSPDGDDPHLLLHLLSKAAEDPDKFTIDTAIDVALRLYSALAPSFESGSLSPKGISNAEGNLAHFGLLLKKKLEDHLDAPELQNLLRLLLYTVYREDIPTTTIIPSAYPTIHPTDVQSDNVAISKSKYIGEIVEANQDTEMEPIVEKGELLAPPVEEDLLAPEKQELLAPTVEEELLASTVEKELLAEEDLLAPEKEKPVDPTVDPQSSQLDPTENPTDLETSSQNITNLGDVFGGEQASVTNLTLSELTKEVTSGVTHFLEELAELYKDEPAETVDDLVFHLYQAADEGFADTIFTDLGLVLRVVAAIYGNIAIDPDEIRTGLEDVYRRVFECTQELPQLSNTIPRPNNSNLRTNADIVHSLRHTGIPLYDESSPNTPVLRAPASLSAATHAQPQVLSAHNRILGIDIIKDIASEKEYNYIPDVVAPPKKILHAPEDSAECIDDVGALFASLSVQFGERLNDCGGLIDAVGCIPAQYFIPLDILIQGCPATWIARCNTGLLPEDYVSLLPKDCFVDDEQESSVIELSSKESGSGNNTKILVAVLAITLVSLL